MEKGNDALLCFNYSQLYGGEGSWGHASLVENLEGDSVALRDPDPKHKDARKVSAGNLLHALERHPGGGVWVIEEVT